MFCLKELNIPQVNVLDRISGPVYSEKTFPPLIQLLHMHSFPTNRDIKKKNIHADCWLPAAACGSSEDHLLAAASRLHAEPRGRLGGRPEKHANKPLMADLKDTH